MLLYGSVGDACSFLLRLKAILGLWRRDPPPIPVFSFPKPPLCVTELLAKQHQAAVSETCHASLSNTITERVARVLLKLKQRWHEADAYGTFPLLLTHQEIAEMVSSRRETVIRSITQLREEGIIAQNGSNITILRHEQLEEMSG